MSDDVEYNEDDDLTPLSEEEITELRRRIDDLEDPTRYMIRSDIGNSGSFLLWYSVSDDTWCSDQITGTMFKRKQCAQAIIDTMEERTFIDIITVLADLVIAGDDEDDDENK